MPEFIPDAGARDEWVMAHAWIWLQELEQNEAMGMAHALIGSSLAPRLTDAPVWDATTHVIRTSTIRFSIMTVVRERRERDP